MVFRFIDFVLAVLKLLMFQFCAIIDVIKIEFSNISIENLPSLNVNHFSGIFNKTQIFFWFFTESLILLLSVRCWAGDNSNLPSNSSISKTVTLNTTFTEMFFKEYLISFVMVCRFKDFALVVFKLLIFQVCGIIRVTKRSFSNISGTERVNSKTEGDFEVFPKITI